MDLIDSFRRGDRLAFERVYSMYVSAIRFYVERVIKDSHTAEDITVEAFSKTFRRHNDFENIYKLRSYLYTTANNAALDHLRSQKRHERVHEEINYLSASEPENMELAYLEAEAIRALYQAIDELPKQARQVIRLVYLEGKKLQEAADELGLSYNTIQNYRARGLELIRSKLIKDKILTYSALMLALSILDKQ